MREPLKPSLREMGKHCYICGPDNLQGLHLSFYPLDDDAVTAEVTPPAAWSGWDGLMHGGLQCALLDEVTAWVLTGLRNRPYFLTMGLDVRYRKPVRLDQKLTLVGRIIQESDRGSRVLGQILNAEGEVLSEATAKILHVDRERFHRIVESAP